MLIKTPMRYTPNGEERMLHIWLPDDWETSGRRYPVMYFFDGHNLFRDADATYGKCWGLESFLKSWDKEMIVVGMECSHHGSDRLDEYSPYDMPGFPWGPVRGRGKECLRWIVEEVKPMIDRTYPTWPFREATGIGGSSMGGLMSLYAAAAHNDVFSKAACLSSAVRGCLADMAGDLIRCGADPDTRVWLSWGTEETGGMRPTPEEDWDAPAARMHKALEALLRMHGADVRLFCQRGGNHCEADWEKQVPDFMRYLWQEG